VNIRKIRYKDIINPKKWKAVLEAYDKKYLGGITLEFCQEVDLLSYTEPEFAYNLALSKNTTIEYCQMVAYRAEKCSDCVEAGSCLHCGCSTPENMYARSNWCSAGKWPAHENDEDFVKHKKAEEDVARKIAASSRRV
jgi:hypothetical protein